MRHPGSAAAGGRESGHDVHRACSRAALVAIAVLVVTAGCALHRDNASPPHTRYAPRERQASIQIMSVPVSSDIAVIEEVPRDTLWRGQLNGQDNGAVFSGPQHFVWQVAQPDLQSLVQQALPPDPRDDAASTTVYFHVDSSQLDARERARLNTLPLEAKRVQVDGYTDGTGGEHYNAGLSQRRAQAVKRYLVVRGVDASRIATAGHGSADPAASNRSATGRAQNRRADVQETLE